MSNQKLNVREPWYIRWGILGLLKGIALTIKHFFRPKFTVQYPEVTHTPLPKEEAHQWKPRGQHRLNVDEQGRVKCVACLLCQTACPSHCIEITPGPAPEGYGDRDKYPIEFKIDMLRCIYCGMCEEACPCDAIVLTDKPYPVTYSREGMIFNKEKLMQN
ncbi:MAG: NADH-quinone oxidoreductase subunit I [Planctomycetota bacterium]|nr:MAG: NADH-quinone oxidoreductase subunit I [Planctomycetota bacterium]